jgi:Tol biopolymer transport system component
MSANGRYIVFESDAPNLVAGDTNHTSDVFLYDQASGVTTRVSVSSTGHQANGSSGFSAISADGRYVAFESQASNLVAGDTNHLSDVFVRDLATGKTSRVSVNSRGAQARCNVSYCENTEPVLSAHGRYVAFQSSATNLVPHDTNRLGDVFVRDRRTGTTTRTSVDSRGRQGGGDRANNGSNAPVISANGRYVAFHSADSNLVRGDTNRVFDIFVHDRRTGRTTRVSVSSAGVQANAESLGAASISSDGRYVALTSLASNLVTGDSNDVTDVFVRDLSTGRTILASLGESGNQGDDASSAYGVAFSANDRYLAFSSWAANLVPGDTNIVPDAFVRDFGRRP